VGGDGSHRLYLWLTDAAGNVNHENRQMVRLRYDTTPPTDVSINTPATTIDPEFIVSWQATDTASGISYYRVQYRAEEETSWYTWFASTTDTSALFTVPESGTDYVFRVTAYDRVGNSATATATARAGLRGTYLPVVVQYWASWYQYDIFEPNNTPEQAYGPLQSDQAYEAYIWNSTDVNDYYHFTPSTTAQVQVALTQIPASCDFDLYIYYFNGSYQLVAYSNRTGTADESVSFTPVAGRQYFARVYRYSGSSNQQPYRLRVTYQ
jgi:hypothetical protein